MHKSPRCLLTDKTDDKLLALCKDALPKKLRLLHKMFSWSTISCRMDNYGVALSHYLEKGKVASHTRLLSVPSSIIHSC